MTGQSHTEVRSSLSKPGTHTSVHGTWHAQQLTPDWWPWSSLAARGVQVPSKENDAFVFLNAFLDVIEAMEDGSTAALDLSDLAEHGVFVGFELPPRDMAYVGQAAVERVKGWVLEAAMQQDIGQTLSTRSCANCGMELSAGRLTCGQCWTSAEACMVSGWPIPAGEKVIVKGAFTVCASREHYNTYVGQYGTCPFTGNVQAVVR